MRYDLEFFVCCCRSFLGPPNSGKDDYYELLGVDAKASPEEIKRAYKKQSLQLHPDKLAQRGVTITPELQAQFTRMKEAYETLIDPYKRETYDAIGERGLKWTEEPFSIDPQELAHNFATSSVYDRMKIFLIFVLAAVAVLILPILICWHVDHGDRGLWLATLIPLWLWNGLIIFYYSRLILLGPITRPDSIPEAEWVDPLPMEKRIMSLVNHLLLVAFEFLIALKLDDLIAAPWSVLFFPVVVFEVLHLVKKWPLARMRVVTVADLEAALGKPFAQFTALEKELIAKRYSVVSSSDCPEYELANKLRAKARHDIVKSLCRLLFMALLLYQLDVVNSNANWWFIFTPFWLMTAAMCYSNYQAFDAVQRFAMERDPTLFGMAGEDPVTQYGTMQDEENQSSAPTPLTEQEKEELKAKVMQSTGKLLSTCCSQCFVLILVVLFVGKLQGAGYSSFWIISPFLLFAAIILCCLGLAIFGVTEVSTDGVDFDMAYSYMQENEVTQQQTVYVPTPSETIIVTPPATTTAVAELSMATSSAVIPDSADVVPDTDATPLIEKHHSKSQDELQGLD